MKRALLLAALLCVAATDAFAIGCDLTVNACPGNAGASNDAGTLDCAGGAVLTLLATFQPAEVITDLVAADCILDFCVQGDITGSANFWDMETANSGALNASPQRPTTGCTGYLNAFGVANSGSAFAAARRSESMVRIATTSYRPSNVAVNINAKVFAIALLIDASTSFEASGSPAYGCLMPNGISLEQIIPGSANNSPVTTLTSGSQMLNYVFVNGSGVVTPTQRHSWGALKAMYR